MSTVQYDVHTSKDGQQQTIVLSGNLTSDCNEMMNELGDEIHMLFGYIPNLIKKSEIKDSKLTANDITKLYMVGITERYYENIWAYLCVRPSDHANYMFSPIDSENRTDAYERLRTGVVFFASKGFDVYIIRT